MATDKQQRQEALLRLVRERQMRSQHEIVDFMRESGFCATQASISRDVRELGLVKVGGRYLPVNGAIASTSPLPVEHPIRGLIKSFDPIGANLIVIRTSIGAASSVAVALDEQHLDEVAGSLAGDDTIFVAVRSRSDQGRLIGLLNAWGGAH